MLKLNGNSSTLKKYIVLKSSKVTENSSETFSNVKMTEKISLQLFKALLSSLVQKRNFLMG